MYYHLYDDMEPELDPLAGWGNEEELMELIEYNENISPNTLEMKIKATSDGVIHVEHSGNMLSHADQVLQKKRMLRKQIHDATRQIAAYEAIITHTELELKSLRVNLEVRIKDIPYYRGLADRAKHDRDKIKFKLDSCKREYSTKLKTYINEQVLSIMPIVDSLYDVFMNKIPRDILWRIESHYDNLDKHGEGFNFDAIVSCITNRNNPVYAYGEYILVYNAAHYHEYGVTISEGNEVYHLMCKFKEIIEAITDMRDEHNTICTELVRKYNEKRQDLDEYRTRLNSRLEDATSEKSPLNKRIASAERCLVETRAKLEAERNNKVQLDKELAELKKS